MGTGRGFYFPGGGAKGQTSSGGNTRNKHREFDVAAVTS